MSKKPVRTPTIWRTVWPTALLTALLSFSGCATVPPPCAPNGIVYDALFMDALAVEVEQSKCGPYCVAALADWEAVVVK